MRLLVAATIASDRYVVVEAADGEEAWELIRLHRPAVALLDVQMPGRTGLELTRAIRQDPALGDVRIVLLTARARESDIAAGIAAGADRYLTKPFSPLELLDTLDRAIETAAPGTDHPSSPLR